MIIFTVQGIIFPLELFPRFVHHPRYGLAFLLSLYFFIPSFLFRLRFKVVIFSRPPFFQPVLRFVSLLFFFFTHFCAFAFEVQGFSLLLEYFLPIFVCIRISSSILSFLFSFPSFLFQLFLTDFFVPLSFFCHIYVSLVSFSCFLFLNTVQVSRLVFLFIFIWVFFPQLKIHVYYLEFYHFLISFSI